MKEHRGASTAKKAACLLTLSIIFGIVVCLVVMLSARVDHYKFLGGEKPIFGGVASGLSHGPTWSWDYSAYSWQEDFSTVSLHAEQELRSLGFQITRKKSDGVTFAKGREYTIAVMPGRSYDKSDFWGPRNDNNQWVTVHVITPATDSLATHLRYSLERSPRS